MTLRDTQETIAGWVRAPEGVATALEEESANSVHNASDAGMRRLEGLIRADDKLDAIGRLEIYANAYFHRILGVLAADFPALRHAMGVDAFHDLVTSYLLVEPSRHPSLRYAGCRLPDFISSHDAASGIRSRSPWAAELADFEWARVDVFDATDAGVLVRESLVSFAPEEFGSLVLRLGPWTRVRSFDYPVDQLWRFANREETIAPDLATDPTSVVVWRKEEVVLHRRIDPREKAALEMLRVATRFDGLCEWTAKQIGVSEAPAQAAIWLEQWIADGLLMPTTEDSGSARPDPPGAQSVR